MRILNLPFTFKPLTTACLISASICLLYLGFWQLDRRQEKMQLISHIELNLNSPPKNIAPGAINSATLYQKVQISGQLLNKESVFLYGRRSYHADKDGYYLLTPLLLADGSKVLVMQGWFSHKYRDNIITTLDSQNENVTVTAFTMPHEKQAFFAPDNDTKNNIWFNIDLKQAIKLEKNSYSNLYLLRVDKQTSASELLPLNTNNLSKLRNDHLEYALTWFALLLAMWVIAAIKSYQRPKP